VLLEFCFLCSYEADFIQGLLKNEKKLARSFNFMFRYIDDVLSLNNSWFGDFVDRIYLIELEIKDITDTDRSSTYLDLHQVCLIRTKEQVGEKRSTACTHRYADCLLKNTSTIQNKNVVNKKLEQPIQTEGELRCSGRVSSSCPTYGTNSVCSMY
jgi:hypothetical protein